MGNVVAERLKELRASKAAIVSAARPQGTSQALGSVADKLSKLKESKAGKAKNASAAEKVLRQIASQVEVVEHRRAHTHSSPSDHEGHYSFDAEESSHAPSSRSPIPVYVSDEQEDVGVSHARAGAPALLRGNVGRQHATRGSPGVDDSSVRFRNSSSSISCLYLQRLACRAGKMPPRQLCDMCRLFPTL